MMRTCQQCNGTMQDSESVCPVCGQTWSEFVPRERRKDRTPIVVRWAIYIGIAVIIALVLLSLII